MTREEAIKILSPNSKSGLARDVDGFSPTQKVLCALEMAIAALHSQKTPAKLDRSQWEGCAECETVYGEDDWDCTGFHEYRIVDCYLEYFDHQFGWEGVKIKFCPNCGRPLTEEAWSELERRIGGNDGTDDR